MAVIGLCGLLSAQSALNTEKSRALGKDFKSVLATIPAWQALGQNEVIVEPNMVMGSKPVDAEAARSGTRLLQCFQGVEGANANVRIEMIPAGRSFRLAISAPDREFLSPALTLQQMSRALGPAEKGTREVFHVGVEGRPEVVTSFRFGNGVLKAMQSNYSPVDPKTGQRIIDKVAIDTSNAQIRELARTSAACGKTAK